MATLGNVRIDAVTTEKPERSVKITDHSVENGADISDHATSQPYKLSITGVVSGKDAAARLKKLEYYMEAKIPIAFICRNYVGGVLIESFNSDHGPSLGGGFGFTMMLKHIRIAHAAQIAALSVPAKVQVKPVGSTGLKQKQKPSDKKKTDAKKKSGPTPAQMAAANGNHVKK